MVLPPNRIGGVRGPGGATLDDIVDALNVLNLATAANVLTLNSINNRLGILSGGDSAPLDWEGLPVYLATRLGAIVNSGSTIGEQLAGMVSLGIDTRSLADAISRTLGNFGDEGTTLPARTLHELAGDIRAALVTGEGENVYERLGSVRDNSLAILQAIGTLPSTPAGETVKALLAALVECCEGGTEPPPPQPENPYPAVCEDVALGPWRVASYADANGTFNLGGPDFDAYVMQFASISDDTFGLVVLDPPTQDPAPSWNVFRTVGEDITFCLSWDLTDNTAPATAAVSRAGSSDWFTELGTSTTISPFIYPVGSHVFTINQGIAFYLVVFVNPGDPPPALNFHLAILNSPT